MQVVQEALEVAQQGRTSITIAHGLSTIMESDRSAFVNWTDALMIWPMFSKKHFNLLLRIFVLERGRVAECGSHSELLALQGIYHNLWHRSTTG